MITWRVELDNGTTWTGANDNQTSVGEDMLMRRYISKGSNMWKITGLLPEFVEAKVRAVADNSTSP